MSPIAEHKCDQLKELGYEIIKWYDTWWCLIMDEYCLHDINNCPYCGKRLEE